MLKIFEIPVAICLFLLPILVHKNYEYKPPVLFVHITLKTTKIKYTVISKGGNTLPPVAMTGEIPRTEGDEAAEQPVPQAGGEVPRLLLLLRLLRERPLDQPLPVLRLGQPAGHPAADDHPGGGGMWTETRIAP